MSLKNFYKKEKYIALHAQTKRFRIVKYIVILVVATLLYFWKGLIAVGGVLLFCVLAGTCLHFFLRWKTKGWTRSWGPYKFIPFTEE